MIEFIKTTNRIKVIGVGGRIWEFKEHRVFVWDDEKVPKMDRGHGYTMHMCS